MSTTLWSVTSSLFYSGSSRSFSIPGRKTEPLLFIPLYCTADTAFVRQSLSALCKGWTASSFDSNKTSYSTLT
jgi:hypothetical protein